MNEYLLELGKGGAVACVAYNPCGTERASQMLRRGVLDRVYRDGERILGKAVFAAKCSVIARYPTQDTLYGPAVLWTLLGDPALRIKRPLPTALSDDRRQPTSASELRIEPNPARGVVSVSYSLPRAANVAVALYNAAGELVSVLDDGCRLEGVQRVRLDTRNLSSGLYFVRMTSGRVQPRFAKLVIP